MSKKGWRMLPLLLGSLLLVSCKGNKANIKEIESETTECAAKYEGTPYSLGDTREEILKKAEGLNPFNILETQEHILLDDNLCLYLDQNDICVAISFLSFPYAEIANGIHIGSTLEDVLSYCGDSYEITPYPEENYTVYSYPHDDHMIKFGVMTEIEYQYYDDERGDLPIVQNIEIYDPAKYDPYVNEKSDSREADFSIEYKEINIALENRKSEIMQNAAAHGIEIEETEEYILLDDAVGLYFDANDACVRISVLNGLPRTSEGISTMDYLDDMIECYGNDYEHLVFAHKGTYHVYRYDDHDYVMEFGFPGTYAGNPTKPLNLDIYHKTAAPIYDYGETFDYEWLN